MLCFGKLSEAHGRLHVPKCVAAWADMYHDWHELFMNEEPRRVGVNEGASPMKNRRLSRKERKLRSKTRQSKGELTLVWPFMMV